MLIKYITFLIFFIFPSSLLSDINIDRYMYSIQYSNVSIAKITVTVSNEKNQISYSAEALSDGLVDQFNSFKSKLEGKMYKKLNEYFPINYNVISTYKGITRKSNVTWNNQINDLTINVTPEQDFKKVKKIPKISIINVVDPFTALINMIDNLKINNSCTNSFRIFDGRRRYDLETIELKRSYIEKDRPKTYEGKVIICGLRFFPIGGHYIESKWDPEDDKFSDIKLYFGFNNQKIFPVKLEVERWFGKIISRIMLLNNL